MVMMLMDEQALEQRRAALLRANAVRLARAELKRQVLTGEVDLAELVKDPPAVLLSAKIGDILEWGYGIGRWRAQRILAGGIAGRPPVARSNARLEHLSVSTRVRIAQAVHEVAPYPRRAS
jgi:hypothetical protein